MDKCRYVAQDVKRQEAELEKKLAQVGATAKVIEKVIGDGEPWPDHGAPRQGIKTVPASQPPMIEIESVSDRWQEKPRRKREQTWLTWQNEANGEAIAAPVAVFEALVGNGAREPAHEKDAAAAGAKKVLRRGSGEFLD